MAWAGMSLENPGTNGQKAKTPILDSLASFWITFTNLWINPVCSPTRAAILTGKYGFRTGVGTAIGGNSGGLSLTETTFTEVYTSQSQQPICNRGNWKMTRDSVTRF